MTASRLKTKIKKCPPLFPPKLSTIHAVAFLLGLATATFASAQGFPNVPYSTSQVGQWIAEIDAEGDPDGDGGFGLLPQDGTTTLGINQLLFHKGHMIAPLARNAAARGEGTRRGAMASFDISNLSDIKRTFFRQDEVTNEIREAHGLVVSSGDILCINTIRGVQFWNVSDPKDIKLLSNMKIDGMNSATYGTTGWWVMGQHPYYYLGSTQRGLHIIKATDPANPVLIKRIPGLDFGIPSVGSVHCVGNLMVLGSAGQSTGTAGPFATLDISDPENPQVLDREIGSGNYSVGVYGNYITTQGAGGLKVWDMTDPSDVKQVYYNPNLIKALYSCFADDFFHLPNFATYEKYDFPFPGSPLVISSGIAVDRKTHEFTEKLGNLIVGTGGGDGDGAKFIPHQASPDSRSPEVNFVNPANLATQRSLRSKIGVIVTDTLDFETVTTSTFVVREVGGAPLAGDFSYSRNYLNFIPRVPLKVDTTYEVVLPSGGIKDIVGNGIVAFRSYFSTGSQVVVPTQPEVLITAPRDGALATPDTQLIFSVANFELGSGGRSVDWFLDDVMMGSVSNDSPIPVNGLSNGPHVLKVQMMENGIVIGASDSVSFTVDPVTHNQMPQIALNVPQQALPDMLVNFDASQSLDPDHGPGPLNYQWEFLSGPAVAVLSSSSGARVSAQLGVAGDYRFRLMLDDGGLTTSEEFVILVRTAPAASAEILMITASGGFVGDDAEIRTRLQQRGLVVTGVDGSVSRSVAESYSVVLISSSIGSTDLNPSLSDAEVPIVTWEPYLYDDFGMTGGIEDFNYGFINVTDAQVPAISNPLTAALPAGQIGLFTGAGESAWGVPKDGAIVGATDGNGRALVFGYPVSLVSTAGHFPARRVGLALGKSSFGQLTPAGLALFDGAVDWAKNGTPTETVPLAIHASMTFAPLLASSNPATLQADVSGGQGTVEYSWEVTGADGVAQQSVWSTSPQLTRVFSAAGNYTIVLRVRDDLVVRSKVLRQVVHRQILTAQSKSSSGLLLPGDGTIWNVNPDNDSVTILTAATLAKIAEIGVAEDPRTLALVGSDEVWVASHDVPAVTIIGLSSRAVASQVILPRGSGPEGIVVDPLGNYVYVALRNFGGIAKINSQTKTIEAILNVLPWPKGLAISHDGGTLYVTHFMSPDDAGKVSRINLQSFVVAGVTDLAISTKPDTITSGRGLPNYLGHPGISPDGTSMLIPSKQDNILRGLARDGVPLNSENAVRAIVSKIDLASGNEDYPARWDLNDSDSPKSVVFSPLGNVAFVALQGSGSLVVIDAYTQDEVSRFPVGYAPDSLVMDAATGILYVHRFLDRQISAFDVSNLSLLRTQEPPSVGEAILVASEKLPAQILLGKKIFYHAADSRMSSNGYISCASCHLDGDTDGRVWDFTDRGEGLRNTTDLRGRAGMGHGPVHWSANFDEIQDFENDIRNHFDGLGFMTEEAFQETSNALGTTKAGRSVELDALAAYVTSLSTLPVSPHRNPDGSLTADAVYGREIFARLNCSSCHSGDNYTDSAPGVRHDVGTLKPTSGTSLTRVDTPTLKGIWASPPYFHDGSALSLVDALEASGPLHGNTSSLTGIEKQQLIAYLKQLEIDDSNPGGSENSRDLSGYTYWRQDHFGSTSSPIGAPNNSLAKDGISNLLKYFAAETPGLPGRGPVMGSTVHPGTPSNGDSRYLQLQVRMRKDSENLRYEAQSATQLDDWLTQSVQPFLLDGSDPDYDLIGLRVPFSNRSALFMRLQVRE